MVTQSTVAEEVRHVDVSYTLIAFFHSVFHVIVNSRNTKLKNGGDR